MVALQIDVKQINGLQKSAKITYSIQIVDFLRYRIESVVLLNDGSAVN